METVMARLSRRGFLGLGATGAATMAFQVVPSPARAQAGGFSTVVDLTHTLTADFPTFEGQPAIAIIPKYVIAENGYNLNTWTFEEHVGTHIDTPLHFSAEAGAVDVSQLPLESLVVPLFVIDVKEKAAADANYMLSVEDITAFEAEHGAIPAGSCVAMNSGWAEKLGTDAFVGRTAEGGLNFPGFSKAATDLLAERGAAGIAVDTISLDPGNSADFAVHYSWLPSGHWGMEGVANLDAVPAVGATIVVGAPKVATGTGGPTRLLALLP
jgi:kynurenine formamidase